MVYLNNATPKWVFSVEEIHTNLLPLVVHTVQTQDSHAYYKSGNSKNFNIRNAVNKNKNIRVPVHTNTHTLFMC